MVRNAKLTREEALAVLMECLAFLSKGKQPSVVRGDLIVLKEWGLDSEHGVELASDLSARLGIEIPADENPLIDESSATRRKRPRTLDETVDYILGVAEGH